MDKMIQNFLAFAHGFMPKLFYLTLLFFLFGCCNTSLPARTRSQRISGLGENPSKRGLEGDPLEVQDLIDFLTFPMGKTIPKELQFKSNEKEVSFYRLDKRSNLHLLGCSSWGSNGSLFGHFFQVKLLSSDNQPNTRYISTTIEMEAVLNLFSRIQTSINDPIYLYRVSFNQDEYSRLIDAGKIIQYSTHYFQNIKSKIKGLQAKLKGGTDRRALKNKIKNLEALLETGKVLINDLDNQYYKDEKEILVPDKISAKHFQDCFRYTPVFKAPLLNEDKLLTGFKVEYLYTTSPYYNFFLKPLVYKTM